MKVLLFLGLIFSFCATAGYDASLLDSGEYVPIGNYKFFLIPDIKVGGGGGVNGLVALETGAGENFTARTTVGSGTTFLQLGGRVKYVLFNSNDYSAGFSIIGSAKYLRDERINSVLFAATPLVSTGFSTDFAAFEPYAGIEIAVLLSQNRSTFPLNFVIGTAFIPSKLGNFSVFAEGNFSILDSNNYLGLGLAFSFDAFTPAEKKGDTY